MSKYKKFKKRIYEIIGPSEKGDKLSILFDIFLCGLVILSCVAVIVELITKSETLIHYLGIFERVAVGIFIVEYIIRLWVCEFQYPECKNKFHAIWEFITSFDSLIDILSIVSILFNQIPKEFAVLRLIKLVKLVRLVKMSDYIKTSGKMTETFEKLKVRVNQIIDKSEEGDIISKIYDIVSVILIILSVSFILVETFPLPDIVHKILLIFEIAIAIIFSIEYILRVWTAPLDYPEIRPDKARMKYIFSFMSLIDLLSIVPVFMASLPTSMGILKIFKLCKILRLVKASRYLSGIANFGLAIKKKKKQILLSIIAMVIMILICSVLMYSFENKEQPEVFNNGFSAVLYCFQMMADSEATISPVTPIGQVLSIVMLLLGGCMLGVPVAIVATGFEDMISEQAGKEEDSELYEVMKMYDSLSEEDKIKFSKMVELNEKIKIGDN